MWRLKRIFPFISSRNTFVPPGCWVDTCNEISLFTFSLALPILQKKDQLTEKYGAAFPRRPSRELKLAGKPFNLWNSYEGECYWTELKYIRLGNTKNKQTEKKKKQACNYCTQANNALYKYSKKDNK